MKKILPTPRKLEYSAQETEFDGFSEIVINIDADETILVGLDLLKERFTVPKAETEILVFERSADAFFEEKNATEQGYILTRDKNATRISAKSSIGFFYGCMTLLQLFGKAPTDISIYDRPDVRYRGNMNTLWAETGVWSYDFGDGIEAAEKRLKAAIDDMVRAKLNLLYADGFGFANDRFPGYNELMTRISAYARVRGMKISSGGYGMGYGASANFPFSGEVFKNRHPYPNGEIYDCIGTCLRDRPDMSPEDLMGRSYGTCLTNDALTDAKIEEIRNYVKNTGVRSVFLHNMDSDEIHEPLWLARCECCRKRFPNDDLYAADGAAGAFAYFYDRILDALLPEFPDLEVCGCSPGYAYHTLTNDQNFEKCRRFWSAVVGNMRNKRGYVTMFRELFVQKTEDRYRYDMLDEVLPAYGSAYFSGGDGFYSDKCYTPSAAYIAFMKNSEVIICANGSALQKPTQYANAEYMWNATNSAFYNVERIYGYEEFTKRYDELREGMYRPDGIYGKDGLLDRSCEILFGDSYGARIADAFRLRGRNNEVPIFTACNVEIWTNHNNYNLPFNWDIEIPRERQELSLERFTESAIVTYSAVDILEEVLRSDTGGLRGREHIEFLLRSAKACAKLCKLLSGYMALYIEADKHFDGEVPAREDIKERALSIAREARLALASFQEENIRPFDIYGGIFTRRDEIFEFVSYSLGQIVQSVETSKRIPDKKRPIKSRKWW